MKIISRKSRTAYVWAVLAILLLMIPACQQQQKPTIPGDRIREFASVLNSRELYQYAIDEYLRYVQNYPMDEREQASIYYTIANLYFDRLHDYQGALAYYLRVKELYPKSELVNDASRRVVECLERLQRSEDAQQALEESTLLDPSQVTEKRPGEVIAKIGDREITTGDLEFSLNNLPPYMRAQIKDRSKKIEYLRQYIATELFYDSAKRRGLDNDKEVIEAAFQAKKNLMVQRLLQEEVADKVSFEESDLELYYRANLDRYSKTDSSKHKTPLPFGEVRSQVARDYVAEKQQEVYERLVDRMMRAEAVEIYEDKIK